MAVLSSLLLLSLVPSQGLGTPFALERIHGPDPQLVEATDVNVPAPGSPGDDCLFIAERTGRILVLEDGVVRAQPFVDLGAQVEISGDVGLRSFQFHPNYAANGQVFVCYDANNGSSGVDTVLARLTRLASDPYVLDAASFSEILRVPQDGRSHGGGALRFDASGMLILGIGDGQPGGDPFCRAQDPSNFLGSMLRIDVDGAAPYGIPDDNPFVGVAGYAPETLHFGLRNPWKWDIDDVTGSMWIADVGQFMNEEVNHIPAGTVGLNFGWSVLEGTDCFAHPHFCPSGIAVDCDDSSLTPPVFEYDRSLGCSVTGATVYRGAMIPELDGRYLFTDFCSKRVWSTAYDAQSGTYSTVEHPITRIPDNSILTLSATCGQDGDGEILFLDFDDGEIYRLVPRDGVNHVCDGLPNRTGVPADLSFLGSDSFEADDLRFEVTAAPPLALSVLFFGFSEQSVPLGNGRICVGAGSSQLARVDHRVSDVSGLIRHEFDTGHPSFVLGGVTPGTTCYFQSWYRDVGGPLGAATNLSSALSIRFRP